MYEATHAHTMAALVIPTLEYVRERGGTYLTPAWNDEIVPLIEGVVKPRVLAPW